MGTDVDVEKLRETYRGFQCHGIVALIDYLASPAAEGIMEIGSSTIGLGEIMNEIFLSEDARMFSAWFRTKSLHIGSLDGSVTPLQWLEKLSGAFEHVSVPARKRFDELCRAFAMMSQAKIVGPVEIHSRRGIFRVPPEKYRRNMTDEEIEPYRVERSMLDGDTPRVRFDAPFEEPTPTKH